MDGTGNGVGQEAAHPVGILVPIRRTMSETVGVIGASGERKLVQLLNVSVSNYLLQILISHWRQDQE